MAEANHHMPQPANILINAGNHLINPVTKLIKAQHQLIQDFQAGYFRTDPEPLPLKHGKKRESRDLAASSKWEESQLLSLPWEVRQMIWKEAVGGMLIHWFIKDRKLRGMRCRSGNPNCQLRCKVWLCKSKKDPWPTIGLIGLLFSCRLIYREVIDFVYTLNTFDTREQDVVAYLPRLLLPRSFNQIQSFKFCWTMRDPPSAFSARNAYYRTRRHMDQVEKKNHYHRRVWFQVWKVITEMENLVNLRVELDITGRNDWSVDEFEILRTVVRPVNFRLVLPHNMARSMVGELGGPNVAVLSILDEPY